MAMQGAYGSTGLRGEEKAGLIVAVAAHAALIAWLMLSPPAPRPMPLPERMTVTIADEVAETSTSPEPQAAAAPAIAPVLADQPAPAPVPSPAVQPAPQPAPVPPPKALPQPAPRVQPQLPAKAQPPAQAQPKPAPARPAAGGGSRLGNDFLKGIAGGTTPGAKSPAPAAEALGPQVRAALSGAITRQLKPKWVAPQGADADQLITVLAWDMNPDGTLASSPRVVSQSGITEANRAQAQRHAEQAIRAVRLAAPFELPADLYPAWRHVTAFRFDRKLSQ
jgi:outer membrane biosynthesis protein TonB